MIDASMFSVEIFTKESGTAIKNIASHPLLKELALLLELNPDNQLAWGINQYFLFATNQEGLDWIKSNIPNLPIKVTPITDDIVRKFEDESLLFFP